MSIKIVYKGHKGNKENSIDADLLRTEDGRDELIGQGKNVFIGKIGKYSYSLFLVTYACVVSLEDTSQTWGGPNANIEKWVDIKIRVPKND